MSDDLGLDLDLGLADDLDIDIEVPASVREAFGVETLILADERDTMVFADADEVAAGCDDELILTDSILIKTRWISIKWILKYKPYLLIFSSLAKYILHIYQLNVTLKKIV